MSLFNSSLSYIPLDTTGTKLFMSRDAVPSQNAFLCLTIVWGTQIKLNRN